MSPPLDPNYTPLEDGQLNLKETELCLALPGSQATDNKETSANVGLTLGLKAFSSGAKRGFQDTKKWTFGAAVNGSELDMGKGAAADSVDGSVKAKAGLEKKAGMAPAAKAQVVGWPPIRSFRKNTMATNPSKNKEDAEVKQGSSCLYVKVSMDGAPYLRKVDLKTYGNYKELSKELEKMFSGFTSGQCGSNAIPSKDGFTESHLMDFLSGSEYVLTYEDKDGDWMLVGDVPWEMFTDSCRKLRIMKGSDAIGLAPRAMEKCKRN